MYKKILLIIVFVFSSQSVYSDVSSVENIDNYQRKYFREFKTPVPEKYSFSKFKRKKIQDISVANVDGIYTIKIDTNALKGELKPYYVSQLATNNEVYEKLRVRLVVNAGFFDPKNQQTVSYLTLDGNLVLDPHNNKNLMDNKYLKPYLDKILNRSEFRVLKSNEDGTLKYDIAPHNDAIPQGYTLLHSVQGGPALVPILRLEEEFFVLTDKEGKIISQSASSLTKHPRTLVGIKNNDVYFIIATKEHPISLPEASDMLKNAGFEKAMAFDGGGSVSVDFRDTDLHIFSEKNNTARKLKSFFIVTDNKQSNPQEYFLQITE